MGYATRSKSSSSENKNKHKNTPSPPSSAPDHNPVPTRNTTTKRKINSHAETAPAKVKKTSSKTSPASPTINNKAATNTAPMKKKKKKKEEKEEEKEKEDTKSTTTTSTSVQKNIPTDTAVPTPVKVARNRTKKPVKTNQSLDVAPAIAKSTRTKKSVRARTTTTSPSKDPGPDAAASAAPTAPTHKSLALAEEETETLDPASVAVTKTDKQEHTTENTRPPNESTGPVAAEDGPTASSSSQPALPVQHIDQDQVQVQDPINQGDQMEEVDTEAPGQITDEILPQQGTTTNQQQTKPDGNAGKEQDTPVSSTVPTSRAETHFPDVLVVDEHGNEVHSLQVVAGNSPAVVFLYPKANTPGCTKQACGFAENYETLRSLGFAVFGLSYDSPKSQLGWKKKHTLPYSFLCDTLGGGLIKALGASKPPKSIKRSHFVVAQGGLILDAQIGVSPGDSVAKALEFVRAHKDLAAPGTAHVGDSNPKSKLTRNKQAKNLTDTQDTKRNNGVKSKPGRKAKKANVDDEDPTGVVEAIITDKEASDPDHRKVETADDPAESDRVADHDKIPNTTSALPRENETRASNELNKTKVDQGLSRVEMADDTVESEPGGDVSIKAAATLA